MKIGYVLGRFPKLSESFILNEMVGLTNLGVQISPFSILSPFENITHSEVTQYPFQQRTKYFSHIRSATSNPEASPLFLRDCANYLRLLFIYAPRFWRFMPILERPRLKLGHMLVAADFTEAAKSLDLDLLHAHFVDSEAIAAMYMGHALGLPFTFTSHSLTPPALFKYPKVFSKLCKEAAGIVAISRSIRDMHIKFGADPKKIRLIHCGIDVRKFHRSVPYDPTSNQLLTVGRLVKQKGTSQIIEALGLLRARGKRLRLKIVGSGPEKENLMLLAAKLGLEEDIDFLGSVSDDDLTKLHENSSAFLLPCIPTAYRRYQSGVETVETDGIPVAIMEAMSMELPVISTTTSGIPELITDLRSGLIVKPNDPRSLADAIVTILDTPVVSQRIGKEARSVIRDSFEFTKNSGQMKEFFTEVLGECAQ